MGWFRIDDRADDNPKLLALSDGALRLWLMGGIHCAKHKTDGLLTQAAAFGLRKFTKSRLDELLTLGLWHQTDTGFQVHDFLDWNLSKAEIDAKQANGRARVQRHRAGANPSVSNALRNAHTANGMVLSSFSSSKVLEQELRPFSDETVTERAGRFIERYEILYQKHRNAQYLVRPQRDYAAAVTLCQTWTDDGRLDKIAAIFLTTDNEFAEKGSRTLPQFAGLASWCDGQLSAWEKKHGAPNGTH